MKLKYLIYIQIILFICSVNVFAKDKVTLEAQSIQTLNDNISIANGNVLIIFDGKILTADKVIFNKSTKEVEAIGNVKLIDNASSNFQASYIHLNFDNNTGEIKEGRGFYPPYTYIKAKNIKKINANRYLLEDAEFTSCKGETPDWSIRAGKAKFDKGDYIYANNPTFRIKEIPLLYSPYFVWPVKEKRETGFLIPDFGSSSKKGEFISPRFFWNLGVDKDITLGINYFTKIGPQYITEFRYAKSHKENIYLYGEYIHQNKSTSATDKENRWLFVNQSNLFILDELEIKFNTHYVSDYKYERDFEEYSIYKNENTDDDETNNKYINEVRLNYYTKYADFAIRYRDDMEYKDTDTGYKQTRVIREPNLIVEKSSLNLYFLKYSYKFDYNKLYSKNRTFKFSTDDIYEDEITDYNYEHNRLHSMLKLYKPINVFIGTFTPSYTQYATRWYNLDEKFTINNKHRAETTSISQNGNTVDRLTNKVNLDFNLNEIYKQYDSFKHSIYNVLSYTYIPKIDHGNLPDLIEDDVIEQKSLYKYTMKNYIKAKNWHSRLEFIQEYDDLLKKNNFSPLETKFDIYLWKIFSNKLDFKRDHYDTYIPFLKNNLTFKYKNFYMSGEFVYDEEITDDDNNNLNIAIGMKFPFINLELSQDASRTSQNLALHSLDKYQNKTFEANIKFITDCWTIGVDYKLKKYHEIEDGFNQSQTEHIYSIYVELKGIGSTNREFFNNDTNF